MIKLRYEKDGNQWTWHIVGEDNYYFQTNKEGEGIYEILPYNNKRLILEGNCQFSVEGLSEDWAKQKIRNWMEENPWYEN